MKKQELGWVAVSLCGLSASLLISAPGLAELPVSTVASGNWTVWGLRAPRSPADVAAPFMVFSGKLWSLTAAVPIG